MPDSTEPPDPGSGRFVRTGRYAWAALGLLGLVVVVALFLGQVRLVVVPLVLALFPAALLAPLVGWAKARRVPPALASILAIGLLLTAVFGTIALVVPKFAEQVPALADAVADGLQRLDAFLDEGPLDIELGVNNLDELAERGSEMLDDVDDVGATMMNAAIAVAEGIAGVVLGLVALFFYLKDGRQIADGVTSTFPRRSRPKAREIADRVWETMGAYFRGQLLVALVDAVFIGLGLLLLGVPLAGPLAVLIFFGGLFPIIGAFITGVLGVLVALADGGPLLALAVLALIIVVQQVESNILEPVILGRAIALHPLMILVAITAGAVTMGILGAFLAVPFAAATARAIDVLRNDEAATGDATPAEDA